VVVDSHVARQTYFGPENGPKYADMQENMRVVKHRLRATLMSLALIVAKYGRKS